MWYTFIKRVLNAFTYIIQFGHDRATASYFIFKEVKYFLRVTQRLENVHFFRCTRALLMMMMIMMMMLFRTEPDELNFTVSHYHPHNPHSHDHLTPLIGSYVMGSERSGQWATRATGVMPRPYADRRDQQLSQSLIWPDLWWRQEAL